MSITLPDGWTSDTSTSYGVVIEAPGAQGGAVTVDESARNFKLGMTIVRERGGYAGRGWKDRLYADAVAALQATLARHEAMRTAHKP